MDEKTYSLISEGEDFSDKYYEDVSKASNIVICDIINSGEYYIRDFIKYIKNNEIEELRSINEYALEILLIGVLLKEYLNNSRAFKRIPKKPLIYLNRLRNEKKCDKEKVDKIRGILINKFLLRKVDRNDSISFNDLSLLKDWLLATNDFNEEIYRINNWISFLKKKEKNYIDNFLYLCRELADHLSEIGDIYLKKYINNVDAFIKNFNFKNYKREDIIYCTKGEIQYYYNMIGADIMNKAYKNKFLSTKEKVIFLPTCMRQTYKECQSILTSKGLRCKGCSESCNINRVNKVAKREKYKVYIIPHESDMFKLVNYEDKKGMVGIACILNLMSGGWKAIRIGYIPQCVILDYCGCGHWRENRKMTNININKLIVKKDINTYKIN